MKLKVSFIAIVIITISNVIIGAANINTAEGNPTGIITYFNEHDAELPTWKVGDSWTYEVYINGEIEQFLPSYDITMPNWKLLVTEVQSDTYKVHLTSDMTGYAMVKMDTTYVKGDLEGVELEGTVYVNKSNLGIEKIEELHADGYFVPALIPSVWFEIDCNLNVNYSGGSPLNFPIDIDENWIVDLVTIDIDISLYISGSVTHKEISVYVEEHDLECTGWETIEVRGRKYDALSISGDLGEQNNMWYALSAGNIIKAVHREIPLHWSEGESYYDIDMELISTNYEPPNIPPNPPSKPSGNTAGMAAVEYIYSTNGTDPDGDKVKYGFNWGDETSITWTRYVNPGETASATHIYSSAGIYNITAKTQDEDGAESNWSENLTVAIESNSAPTTPTTPDGPTYGSIYTAYNYNSSSIDLDGNQISYWFDWGDDTNSGWLGPYNSGENCEIVHTWIEQGNYQIKVKAKDEHGAESNWSEPLSVSMPKNKVVDSLVIRFLKRLENCFSWLERLFSPIHIFTKLLNTK